jgi:plasmid stabilization system protein ParE
MPREVVWSPLAESDFANILAYLNENWDEVDILRIYDTRQDPNTLTFK